MNKKAHVLDTELGAKTFVLLLQKEEGLSGYDIAKNIYNKVGYSSPNKIYTILDRLKADNLIIEFIAQDNNRDKKINKINFDGFTEFMNNRLNEPLNSEEKQELKNILISLKSVFKYKDDQLKNAKLLEAIITLIKLFSDLSLEGRIARNVKYNQKDLEKVSNIMGYGEKGVDAGQIHVLFSNCSDSTLKKLQTLEPTPFYNMYKGMMNEIIGGLNKFGKFHNKFFKRR